MRNSITMFKQYLLLTDSRPLYIFEIPVSPPNTNISPSFLKSFVKISNGNDLYLNFHFSN